MVLYAGKETAERAVNGLLDGEAAICGDDPYCYSMTASAAFEEIALLRGKGMRFEKICAAFAKEGLLPDDAKPHSLPGFSPGEKKAGKNGADRGHRHGEKIERRGNKPGR